MNGLPAHSILFGIMAIVLLLLTAWGIGRRLHAWLPLTSASRFADRCLDTVLGLNCLAWIAMTLGQLRFFQCISIAWLLPLLFVMVGLPSIVHSRDAASASKRLTNQIYARRWLDSSVPWLACLTMGPALCYPDGWDELVYHHQLPKLWLEVGYPRVYPDLVYSAFPSMAETLAWIATPIDAMRMPRLIGWSSWVLALTLLEQLLRRIVASWQAVVLTAALGFCNAMLMVVNNAYAESTLAMDFVALVWYLVAMQNQPHMLWRAAWSIRVGLLAGGVVATKLTGICVLFVLGLYWLRSQKSFNTSDRISLAVASRGGVLLLLTMLLFAAPFYLRPWLETGSPCYPYFARLFTQDPAILETSQFHHLIGDNFGTRHWSAAIACPVLISFDGILYDGNFGFQTMLLVVLAGVAVWQLKRLPVKQIDQVVWLSLSGLALYAFWFASAQQARFGIPAWICLIVVAAFGLSRLPQGWQRWSTWALGLLTLWSAPWHFAGYYFSTWATDLGTFPAVSHVDEGTGFEYLAAMEAINDLPEDARVLLLFEHRGFYCPRQHVIGTPSFQPGGFTPVKEYTSPEAVQRCFDRLQVTHLLLAKQQKGPDLIAGFDEVVAPLLEAIEQSAHAGRLKVLWQSDAYYLMSIAQ